METNEANEANVHSKKKDLSFYGRLKKFSNFTIISYLSKRFIRTEVSRIKKRFLQKLLLEQHHNLFPNTFVIDISCTGIVSSLDFSPCENFIVYSCDLNNIAFVKRIDDEKKKVQDFLELVGHTNSIKSVAFSKDGRFVATGGRDTNILIHSVKESDPNFGKWIIKFDTCHTDWIRTVAFCPGGDYFASCGNDSLVNLFKLGKLCETEHPLKITKSCVKLTNHSKAVISLSFNFNGTLLATGGVDKKLVVIDLSKPPLGVGSSLVIDSFSDGIVNVKFNPIDNCLAVSYYNRVKVFSIVEVNGSLSSSEIYYNDVLSSVMICSLAFSNNGIILIAAGCDSQLAIHRPFEIDYQKDESQKTTMENLHKNRSVRAISYSPRGSFLATGGDDKKINILG